MCVQFSWHMIATTSLHILCRLNSQTANSPSYELCGAGAISHSSSLSSTWCMLDTKVDLRLSRIQMEIGCEEFSINVWKPVLTPISKHWNVIIKGDGRTNLSFQLQKSQVSYLILWSGSPFCFILFHLKHCFHITATLFAVSLDLL